MKRISSLWDINSLEAQVVLEGIKVLHAKFDNNLKLEIESDSLTVVRNLNQDDSWLSELKKHRGCLHCFGSEGWSVVLQALPKVEQYGCPWFGEICSAAR